MLQDSMSSRIDAKFINFERVKERDVSLEFYKYSYIMCKKYIYCFLFASIDIKNYAEIKL